ncbi:23S rRNA (cytidine1920-2'-O)/16S rRNA (cytidine1409-2'-O)-methyltransferase [Clostridium acetobutylicum]|uniref:Predicted rRNA methylase, YQXC B.subtilis ortholog n=1 Tax=Clostridium acetobutylicum (strain ATCC 824 / DSM 792 / JCM 1419 / IAM 19013 / LMG 5710 / NBRC 13948 / NRRL B-527 / VKM B-1787 / 2291 / W) TaxID=272562 RepID=Q97HD6_CLOAB|nr:MULTISPECIES: TlyA family rRNA (cytidine-2'-O)-methyltransferase [Clostridium]AAK80035.1 Predicted rRNA methylase, YQXC B.subtilis ortholog [Clostridium acetobutylicum ATCC 824]ADZ21127.1 rRNA methylase [Clostridium acetobutylicum EA 2018]AEI33267.1 rRNA methylase [Clostridium acetobutylicum DSM 1731]AWV79537.1 TlyA family rRNA (cytidine-2'-O)-methyltransferase [Clostridium acetobutylicum]KHD38224.1 RNA methyltransferase [Clostridium acetobutylicum]
MSENKERLDVLLVEKGIFESREKARASIMAGEIYVDDLRIDKCGQKVKVSSKVEFRGEKMPYVSRGGYKLERAIKSFGLGLKDKVCFDIGASTGGFTDCMLQNGASKVFAIDVGYGQFAWKLRTDPRVVCMERTNVRYVTPEDIGEFGNFASIDVSFISLKKVIPVVINLLKDDGEIVALIKPQFEAGREKVGKRGVVREPETHIEVINTIVDFLKEMKLSILGITYSPIKGPEGNIEYLVYFSKKCIQVDYDSTESVVENAHKKLD